MYTTPCNCVPFAATTTHVNPTMYQHTTTATATTTTTTTNITTAIVETPLDSRAQPVATEHAVPSTLPQGQHPLAVGKNKLLTTTILLLLLNMYAQSSDFHQCMYVPS